MLYFFREHGDGSYKWAVQWLAHFLNRLNAFSEGKILKNQGDQNSLFLVLQRAHEKDLYNRNLGKSIRIQETSDGCSRQGSFFQILYPLQFQCIAEKLQKQIAISRQKSRASESWSSPEEKRNRHRRFLNNIAQDRVVT